jgi:hypothetical protein
MKVKTSAKACDVRAVNYCSGKGQVTVTIDGDRDDFTALLKSLLRALGLKSPTGISLTAKRGYSLRLPGPCPKRNHKSCASYCSFAP